MADMDELSKTTLRRLRKLQKDSSRDEDIQNAMLPIYGWPIRCLACSKLLPWPRTIGHDFHDVGFWFCPDHCPTCHTDEEITESMNERDITSERAAQHELNQLAEILSDAEEAYEELLRSKKICTQRRAFYEGYVAGRKGYNK